MRLEELKWEREVDVKKYKINLCRIEEEPHVSIEIVDIDRETRKCVFTGGKRYFRNTNSSIYCDTLEAAKKSALSGQIVEIEGAL